MLAGRIVFGLIVAVCPSVLSRPSHSLPEDFYAFPKYRVTFLNSLPLLNDSAQKWLSEGLKGGELEFIGQPWREQPRDSDAPSPREIEGGQLQDASSTPSTGHKPNHDYSLQLMKMGPRDSYLCFVPQPPDGIHQPTEPDSNAEVTPAHSWSLLQPLSGTCLYHRRGWFTYSYCHNQEIRQFKALPQPPHKHIAGYQPEEDPEWDSYTLGKAPPTPEPGADLTVAEQASLEANLELAKGAGSRYLVQRWGDGTVCDKTGKKREVEVQFHCSMTMTDTILFVKEMKTCSYLVVINTPRLCGEPGFRSPSDSREEAFIRCREIVPSLDSVEQERRVSLPDSDHPVQFAPRKSVISPPPPPKPAAKGKDASIAELLQQTLNSLLANNGGKLPKNVDLGETKVVIQQYDENGDIVYDVLDELPEDIEIGWTSEADTKSLVDTLRAAGYEIIGEKTSDKEGKGNSPDENSPKKTARRGETHKRRGNVVPPPRGQDVEIPIGRGRDEL